MRTVMSICIVREKVKSVARAKMLLAKVRPFNEWVNDEKATRMAERVFGMPAKDLYEKLVSELQDIAVNGVVTTVTARERKVM